MKPVSPTPFLKGWDKLEGNSSLAESYCAVSVVRVFRADELGRVRDLPNTILYQIFGVSPMKSITETVSKSSSISFYQRKT